MRKQKSSKKIAIFLLGGIGKRFDAHLPKQFVMMGGKPLMCHGLSVLNETPLIDVIYVVSAPQLVEATKQVIDHFRFRKVEAIISGGETREDSVFKALVFLKRKGEEDGSIVLIQDGDRPNLTVDLIRENIMAALINQAAVTAIPADDSIILSDNGTDIDKYLPRNSVYLAQTPQTFTLGLIYKAHVNGRKKKNTTFTDDASMVRNLGHQVAIVKGSKDNLKINTRKDSWAFEGMKNQ